MTATGWETMITCEPSTSVMFAPARSAIERTRSAPAALSPVATTAHVGKFFQAGGPFFSENAASAIGRCVAPISATCSSGKSEANASRTFGGSIANSTDSPPFEGKWCGTSALFRTLSFEVGVTSPRASPSSGAKEALARCEFLVCQELFLTETAALAHVVLPATSYAEKDGTFTNTEGLVQPVRTAIDPIGESRPDWEILSTLSVLMGYPIEYGDAKEIFKEIRSVIPGYALLGPVPTPPRPDADAVAQYLERGYAEDVLQRYRVHTREADVKGKGGAKTLALVLTQSLFHSGKFSTRAKGLLQVEATGKLALNPLDAERWSLGEGDPVRVANERGEMITTVTLRDRLPEGLATYPEHFDEQARVLMPLTIDKGTGVPYYRSARVEIEPLKDVELERMR